MLASSFYDPMLGIDIHWEMVPMPAPVPTPIPNPFTGIVFDPIGLAAGLAISNAIGAVMGASLKGPVLYWSIFPATNTGTEGKHIPGHILIPPGTAWAPVPKTPKPVVRPGETPKPPKPVSPDNDAVIVFGSKTVSVMGSNAVRMGDLALSCSEPVRLPSTVVLAVPKGRPILIGGPPSLDIMAAIMASLRTRFMSDSLHALISRLSPGRFRNLLHRVTCFLTGHPVDVASGKMVTDFVDAELPGPLPLKIERNYSSAFAGRNGLLGHGWSLSLDQAIWEERGQVVYLAEDGREIVFDTFDFPEHRLRPGDEVWHPIDRLTLRCEGQGKWRVTSHDGVRREFAPAAGRNDGRSQIQRMVSRCGFHEITFTYDKRGRLESVRDSAGRRIRIEQDEYNRIVALKLPHPHEDGWYVHRRYKYDSEGDLVRVVDSTDNKWSFEYVTHLMVRETDRTGFSFYFEYDGLGEDAWCTRTWGDGGIYDHVIRYDKKGHVTFVTNSLGHTTQYHMNIAGLVLKVVDPLGAVTEYDYDPVSLQQIAERGPGGHGFAKSIDAKGNVTQIARADGTTSQLMYGPFDQLSALRNEIGATWAWEIDADGLVRRCTNPLRQENTYGYQEGLLCRVSRMDGAVMTIKRGPHGLPVHVRMPGGAEFSYSYDQLGRMTSVRGPQGTYRTLQYDPEWRVVRETNCLGLTTEYRYDGEGNIIGQSDPRRQFTFRYGGFHDLISREEAGTRTSFAYDTEGNVTQIITPDGERILYEYDPLGRVVKEIDVLGGVTTYRRDAAGRVIERRAANGDVTTYDYDLSTRLTRMQRADGCFLELTHREDGVLLRAANETGAVEMERDVLGRVVAERTGTADIRVAWAANGQRGRTSSNLGLESSYDHDQMGGPSWMRPTAERWKAHDRTISYQRDAMGAETTRWLPGGVTVRWERDVGGRPLRRVVQRGKPGVTSGAYVSDKRWSWRGEALTSTEDADGTGQRFRDGGMGRIDAKADNDGDYRVRTGWGSEWRRGLMGRVEEGPTARYEYDVLGRRVAKIEADGGRWSYGWNSNGLLKTVTKPDGTCIEFEYDAMGRRVRKRRFDGECICDEKTPSTETTFTWDGDFMVHESVNGGHPITWYWDLDSFTLAGRESEEGFITFCSDPLGAPVQAFDEQGELRWSTDRDLSDHVTSQDGDPTLCPWRGLGQYEDEETGLYYNRFRYYDPECGQYLSSDPLGFQSGTFHGYDYVDDPLTWADPLGLIQGPTQVPYDGHDLFDGPGGVRETAAAMSNAETTRGNIAVALLDDGTRVPIVSEAPAGRPRSPRNVFHSEFRLLNGDIDPRRIVALYTEREPCRACLDDLRRLLGEDVPVMFTHPHVPGQEGAVQRAIRDQRRACG